MQRLVPDYLIITDLLKATPSMEGEDRFIFLEASNEALDHEGEIVLAKALEASADYYLRYGNLDLEHYTQIGAKRGIPNPHLYEIGRPVEVRINNPRTFVKAQLFRGEGVVAEKANHVWDSLTKLTPPQRWYPSVGGAVLAKGDAIDPATRAKRAIVSKVRWTNIGLSKTPMNPEVPTAASVPFGAFAKAFCSVGECWDLTKALSSAGASTDVAGLSGGAALTGQSMDPHVHSYWDFREQASADMKHGRIKNGTAAGLIAHAVAQYGVDKATAAEWVERYLQDLQSNLKRSNTR